MYANTPVSQGSRDMPAFLCEHRALILRLWRSQARSPPPRAFFPLITSWKNLRLSSALLSAFFFLTLLWLSETVFCIQPIVRGPVCPQTFSQRSSQKCRRDWCLCAGLFVCEDESPADLIHLQVPEPERGPNAGRWARLKTHQAQRLKWIIQKLNKSDK